MCVGKFPHPTKRDAKLECRRLNTRLRSEGKEPVHTYSCSVCGFYHLGHYVPPDVEDSLVDLAAKVKSSYAPRYVPERPKFGYKKPLTSY